MRIRQTWGRSERRCEDDRNTTMRDRVHCLPTRHRKALMRSYWTLSDKEYEVGVHDPADEVSRTCLPHSVYNTPQLPRSSRSQPGGRRGARRHRTDGAGGVVQWVVVGVSWGEKCRWRARVRNVFEKRTKGGVRSRRNDSVPPRAPLSPLQRFLATPQPTPRSLVLSIAYHLLGFTWAGR